MPQLISLPFLQTKCTQFDPMSVSHSIGEQCRVCKQRIVYPKCISICGCHRYVHEKCMVKHINEQNIFKDEIKFKCKICNRILQVNYSIDIKTHPHVNACNIVLFIFAFLWLPFAIYSAMRFRTDYLKEFLNAIIILVLLVVLTYAIVNSLVIKQYNALTIKSTQLGLVISAFVQLEKELQGESTHTEMVR